MFHIALANHIFTIHNRFAYTAYLCRDYVCEQSGQEIVVSDAELALENRDGGHWPDAYLESLAVYRKICERLLEENILLFHCSALCMDGQAYLFTAPSGTGKSTHARLWRERFGHRVTMINDDKPLLEVGTDRVTVYGTPYAGKDGLQTNISAPVGGIIVLYQASDNVIQPMNAMQAYPILLNQTYRRQDPQGMIRTMDLVRQLAELPVYSLGCTISTEAVELAYQTLTERMEHV